MPQRIFFDHAAKAQIRDLDKDTAMRILDALDRLQESGKGDIKKLRGFDPPEYRLRVGEYRVRYRHQNGSYWIVAVTTRGRAYR
jgi:mRNA interferase RelE/StbE